MRSTRRTMSTRGRGRTRNVPSSTQVKHTTNNDHCDVCTYGGRMMCCDGCPKAFHFTCLVPPLDVDNPPTGNWYCRECSSESTRQSQQRGRKGRRKGSLFKELKDKAHISNPTAFMLPENIRNTFDGVFAGKHGEYRDSNKEKPVQLDKRGYPVEPDRERFVDTKGRSICCYYCKLPPRHLRPIMSCDFCDQHWHFDCLTPPLTIAPPLHKKWMCPLHADHVLPPMRRLRGEDVLPYMDNTAIEHQPEKRRIECDPEFYLNDTLHKLPRQSVRLDWIGQMKTALEENNEKVIAATEKALPSKKEGKKPEVSPQKGKGKEFFLGDEVGKDLVGSKAAIELLDEDVQMTMAIELSQMKSRLECDGKENEKEDEGAGPSRSNCDNYGDERIAKRLRPEDYESSVSSSSSTNVRVHTEPVEVGPENLKVEERTANRFHQYNEIHDKNEDIIGNNAESIENKNEAENYEGNPLFLLVEAAFGGF
ncbi:Rco1p [Rhizophagus irregularis DAOM 197198w]|uniref:Rco1p n=1 Tax=Rhizophagus irregularis (strain DAOM 197198w) TaxID=1432141 RepID=A0A015L1T0_RHIIW|nr:Rco1p [Rhizophagus irregularis DAOM 197198w]PKY18559.1 hypothetical protein RhiirB3_351353 [Rhizophagus irregularis]